MKIFFYLFSLYILILAGIPCAADDNCCVEEAAVHAAFCQPEKKTSHPPYPAPCSPFFACGASHGFIIPGPILPIPGVKYVQSKQQAFYLEQALPDLSFPIWQPPQLG